jgi:hypothetical protein
MMLAMAELNPIADLSAERAKHARLPPGGGGGHDGCMPPDERVAVFETQMTHVREDIGALRAANLCPASRLPQW